MESTKLSINNVLENKGQIEGVPANPRTISKDKFELLKQSIAEDPEMLNWRPLLVMPHKNKFVVIGGNMRFKALKDLGHSFVQAEIIPADTDIEKVRRVLLKDNSGFGAWDHDLLSSEFSEGEILASGIDIPLPPEDDAPIEPDKGISDISTKLHVEAGDVNLLRDLFIELQARGFVCELK